MTILDVYIYLDDKTKNKKFMEEEKIIYKVSQNYFVEEEETTYLINFDYNYSSIIGILILINAYA